MPGCGIKIGRGGFERQIHVSSAPGSAYRRKECKNARCGQDQIAKAEIQPEGAGDQGKEGQVATAVMISGPSAAG